MNTIRRHWKSILGLLLIYIGIYFNWSWIWGIFFLLWVVPSLFTGVAFLFEPIERKTSPVLFWLITATWIALSGFLLAEPLLPPEWQTNGIARIENYTQPPAQNAIPALADGTYSEPPQNNGEIGTLLADSTQRPDSLKYKTFRSEEQFFIGVQVLTTHVNDQYLNDMEGLWDYFSKNDISEAISNIVDERVYLVYSEYDQPSNGNFKMTLGYRTSNLSTIYEGLEGVAVPPLDFAVFESKTKSETFVQDTWLQIAESDLPRSNQFDVEVYQLDPQSYAVLSSQLRISLKK